VGSGLPNIIISRIPTAGGCIPKRQQIAVEKFLKLALPDPERIRDARVTNTSRQLQGFS